MLLPLGLDAWCLPRSRFLGGSVHGAGSVVLPLGLVDLPGVGLGPASGSGLRWRLLLPGVRHVAGGGAGLGQRSGGGQSCAARGGEHGGA